MAKRYVTFKSNCRFARFTDALDFILGHLNKIMNDIPSIPDLMVTSVNDSEHSRSPLSRHYTDEAVDIRTHNFTDLMQVRTFVNQISARLNTDPEALKANCFTVLHESIGTPNEHIHIQVKIGCRYE